MPLTVEFKVITRENTVYSREQTAHTKKHPHPQPIPAALNIRRLHMPSTTSSSFHQRGQSCSFIHQRLHPVAEILLVSTFQQPCPVQQKRAYRKNNLNRRPHHMFFKGNLVTNIPNPPKNRSNSIIYNFSPPSRKAYIQVKLCQAFLGQQAAPRILLVHPQTDFATLQEKNKCSAVSVLLQKEQRGLPVHFHFFQIISSQNRVLH